MTRETLRDGTHPSGARWFVERVPGVDAPLVSVIGTDGLFNQVEMPGACGKSVNALIEAELARRAKKAATA